jgi:hypothetical protein
MKTVSGRYRLMAMWLGLAREAGEVVLRDALADERAHHLDRDLGIGARLCSKALAASPRRTIRIGPSNG